MKCEVRKCKLKTFGLGTKTITGTNATDVRWLIGATQNGLERCHVKPTRRWLEMRIIKTRDQVNGDARNYGVLKYLKKTPGGYQGRTASGQIVFVPGGRVQAIQEVV